MSNKLPHRHEVPEELKWNLASVFPSQEAFDEALEAVVPAAREFAEKYEGKIAKTKDADLLINSMQAYENLLVKLFHADIYGSLGYSADMSDTALQKQDQRTSQKMAQAFAAMSFFTNEMALADADVLIEAAKRAPQYSVYLDDIVAYKPHQLSPETERVLASLTPALSFPYQIYETMKAADMRFPDFEAGGKSYPLSYVAYENNYSHEADTDVRRQAFATFSETLGKYRHSTAAAYNAQVQKEKTMATLRGFESVFDSLLFSQKVSRKMYDRQIDVIMKELAPHMRRYAKLLQKAYGLAEIRYSDLKLVLDPEFSPKVTIEESKQYIADAMGILGEDYQQRVMQSYDERWVDFAQNIGKSTGGFCATVPQAHPFILLNWSGDLSEVFTLAHELGHAMQGLLSFENNSILQADLTRYDVEAPSTFHEMLLTESLLQQDKGPRFKRWVLSSMISNTYYHNYVTHLLEAAYQREVYRLVDKGESLQADTLDQLYHQVLLDFWGDSVVLDEGAERTWMRQPHYYMGLYSYVYSASLTISTAMAMKLKAEGQAVVGDWLRYLQAGGPMPPAEHAAMVGIDITTDKPLRDSIAFIGQMIDQIEELGEEISAADQ